MDSKRRVRSMRKREDIPMDVMEEILMKLPLRDILRCKSLSKTYYALIKNPRFINKQLLFCSLSNKEIITVIGMQSGSSRTYNLFSVRSSSLSDVYAPISNNTRSNAAKLLVGSSNGLVCAAFDPFSSPTIELWNPATREHRTIPHPPNPDPYNSHMGFGYEPKSDDYKLVMITSHRIIPRVQWWSMKTDQWRQIRTGIELMVTTSPTITHRSGVYIRGKLYWLACIKENENSRARKTIMSFDLVNNSFCSEAAVPDSLAGWKIQDMNVFDFMGSITLSAGYNCSSPEFDIWVMNDCNKTWATKLTIGPFPYGFWYTRVCTDGELLITNGLHSCPEFLLYDLRKNKQKLLLQTKLPDDHAHISPPCSYYESLVSVLHHTSKQ